MTTLAPNRAEQLLRLPFDLIEWPADGDAELDEPHPGNVVHPCCPICHEIREPIDGYPSCPGAPFAYIAGEQARPEAKPRPEFCRLTHEPSRTPMISRRSTVSLDELRLAHVLYTSGLAFDEVAARVWRRFGYATPRSCATALRAMFHREGFTVRKQGRPRKAA